MYYEYRHYIFDLGTLFDTSAGTYDACCYALERMGLPVIGNDEIDGEIERMPFDEFIGRFRLSQEDVHRAITIYLERFAQKGVQKAIVYPGIEEILQYLWKSDCKISVITQGRTNLARAILRRQKLLQYVQGVYGTDAQEPKTGVDLIYECMQSTMLLACQTIVIGNSFLNFECAKECGVSFLGAGYGRGDVSNYISAIDIPDEGYWGIIDDSSSFIRRFREIMETDITPPAVFKDGPVEVSVVILTYNHERYVRECLDSVLLQNTNFRFEILVGDDASSDDTPDILREYLERYPSIFHLVLRQENIGATKNVYDMFQQAKGRYIAFVEGDDYWTDIYKLQIQYDFLEKNPSYSFCTHRCVRVNENGIPLPEQLEEWWSMPAGKTITAKDLDGTHMPGYALTEMIRNFWKDNTHDWSIQYKAHPLLGDHTSFLLLLLQGDGFIIDRFMGHYRRITNGQNAISMLYLNPNFYYEQFIYFLKLEDYAQKEFGVEVYYSRRDWLFKQVAQARLLSPTPRIKANIKKMIELSNEPWKYRLILYKEYCLWVIKTPKVILKKMRNRYHSLLLERIGIGLDRVNSILQWKNVMNQQITNLNTQVKEMSQQMDTIMERMNVLIEKTDMYGKKDN